MTSIGGQGCDAVGPRTLQDYLSYWAESNGDAPYLASVKGDQVDSVSFERFQALVERAAAFLLTAGVEQGDRFTVTSENTPAAASLLFAAGVTGSVAVFQNTRLTPPELQYQMEHCHARLHLADDASMAAAATAAANAGIDTAKLESIFDEGPPSGPRMRTLVDNERDVAILYTSGTTSRPKGVRISQAALLNAGLAISSALRMTPADRTLAVLPFYHINGLSYNLMTALVTGASVALTSGFSVSRYFREATASRSTIGWLTATAIRYLLTTPADSSEMTHALRAIIWGQNLTDSELDGWNRKFGVPLIQLYGMTELVTLPILNPLFGPSSPDCLGMPVPGVRARVVDAEGRVCPIGLPGELQVHLRPVREMMSGYLDDEPATERAFQHEWFRTGDVAAVDDLGRFRFIDRATDLMKCGGENVAAAEVEMAIRSHPQVFDCAVVGAPHSLRGEVPFAFVVPTESSTLSTSGLEQWCAGRLARFKVPAGWELVSDLPRNVLGKVQKHELVARLPMPDDHETGSQERDIRRE